MTPLRLKRLCHWLAKPALLHWIMPYLMALVVAGTIAQKYIGLYDSQKMFFSSIIFWIGLVPAPGGRTVTALLLLSLLAKIIIASPWRKATAGIFIAHLGVLLLLVGGLITAASSKEGYVALEKNDTATSFADYHARMLTISKNNVPVKQVAFDTIVKGQTIADVSLPFTLKINDFCRNCTMAERHGDKDNLQGAAQKVMLAPIANYLEEERNLAGIELSIENAGTYIAFEPLPLEKQPAFTINGDHYTVTLGRANYPLPFTLQLLEAEKELHPGTDVPRSYRSVVMLSDGEINERAVITMNHPLRYKGYTVYQASFNNAESLDTKSVSFAIVQNSGRVFPYVASITLCIGLLLHLCLRLPTLIRRSDA